MGIAACANSFNSTPVVHLQSIAQQHSHIQHRLGVCDVGFGLLGSLSVKVRNPSISLWISDNVICLHICLDLAITCLLLSWE